MSAKAPRTAVAIDLGATSIKGGLVDGQGTIRHRCTLDTLALHGPEAVLNQLSLAIQELIEHADGTKPVGIGIGSPGVVTDDGVVHHPPNFADWDGVNLRDAIEQRFQLPVRVDNDANAAALGEATFGTGVNEKNFLFVIWGTGVGGGIILDGHIYRGPFGGAGEIGHVTIDYNGPECNCGNRGCVEAYIGQRYLSARTRRRLEDERVASKIAEMVDGNFDRIEPYIISMAAGEGDAFAIEIMREAGELLGTALASVLNVLDLRLVIVGGGISAAGALVFDAIERSLRSHVMKPNRNRIRVLPAALGNDAGILGAGSLILFPEKARMPLRVD